MSSGRSLSSMLDHTDSAVSKVIKESISGITTDNTIILAKVAAEDRDTVGNVIKSVSLVCNPPNGHGGVSVPYDIGTMKSAGNEREYSVGISVSGSMIRVDKLVDLVRACHPNILE